MRPVPPVRVHQLNAAPVGEGGDFVLYWMVANRRVTHSFALQHAVARAQALGKGLVVFEPLRLGYRWASDRLHQFVLDGMRDNRERLKGAPALYYPYVEPEEGAGRGLLETLAERACLVVTDDWPCFFIPRMQLAAAERVPVRMERVDTNGLYPMYATDRVFARAFDFRRHLQKSLLPHLLEVPVADPLAEVELPRASVPQRIRARWPAATAPVLNGETLSSLPIDHEVGRAEMTGGTTAAVERWRAFLDEDLPRYGEDRNHPDDDSSSGLSPWLHFGHISAHQVFAELADREGWSPEVTADSKKGQREGWWGMSASAEAFLDELITWRELGWNFCSQRPDYDRFESLPDWAQETIAEHRTDERPHLYTHAQLERAETHDEVWNAAQRQIVETGRMHNYLRMLWGKKIYEWTRTAEEALEIMVDLNNKYGVDGRDPNSYSGIFWVLGRYDRPWGPERPVFGKLRYMKSEATVKKLRMKRYLARFSGQPTLL